MSDRFRLTKWYLDCVTPEGEALIGYWAELRWRRLALRYVSVMTLVGDRMEERSSLRAGEPPVERGDLVEWRCPALDCEGAWESAATLSLEHELHRKDEMRLTWRCLQPHARARVSVRDRSFEGDGYSEIVTLSIPPWDLPIDELRWGRAHCGGHSVVWVDWTGDPAERLVLFDGVEVPASSVSDSLVDMGRAHLSLAEGRTIRSGPVAGTSVGSAPGVAQALARAGLSIDEHKWLSNAVLRDGDEAFRGTAIHEVVKWR